MNRNPPSRDYFWENFLEQASQPGFFERNDRLFSRRAMLARCFNGIGALGLAAALGERAFAAELPGLISPRPSHFPARAKRVIHLWMNGAPSQVDTFDPKPALEKFAGQAAGEHRETDH